MAPANVGGYQLNLCVFQTVMVCDAKSYREVAGENITTQWYRGVEGITSQHYGIEGLKGRASQHYGIE